MNLSHPDISRHIDAFTAATEDAAYFFADLHGLTIKSVHVESALIDTLSPDDSSDLLDLHLSTEQILSALEEYDFRVFFPVVLSKVVFKKSIIPHSVPKRLLEQRVRHHGQVWQINQNDADPHPSNPHAHNLETGYKLDLSTGDLFLGARYVGEKISRKDLLAIRVKASHVNLPPLLV